MSEPPIEPDSDADSVDEGAEAQQLHEKTVRRRRVLKRVSIAILVALGVYAVWPWLLPAFIYEGPMVQLADADGVSLVWYMSRPAGDGLTVRVGDDGREFAVERDGKRCRARLSELPPNAETPYKIVYGGRVLAESTITTDRTADQPYSFVVFGDSGKGNKEQYLLADRMAAVRPDFVLHTGDLIYNRGERRLFADRFFTPYANILSRICFWPSVGNHDVAAFGDNSPYFGVFDLPENGPLSLPPEHDYWFDYANARVAVVDSEHDEDTLREHVAPWLREVMTTTDADWRFVVLHRPPFTAGSHSPCVEVQRTLVPAFEEVGVDIVFSGHDHMYERTRAVRAGSLAEDGVGVVYVISGAGGAQLYDVLPADQRPDYFASLHNEIHSFTRVVIDGHRLTLDQIALDGETLDHWELNKSGQE